MNTTTTPLADWLRAATPEERERMATLAGTKVNYLYQLAGCARSVPKADLAFGIEEATKVLHTETAGRLPIITARTVATMCVACAGAGDIPPTSLLGAHAGAAP